jgi:nitrite reductase/ring-hydroxylating ferredoxin subunit
MKIPDPGSLTKPSSPERDRAERPLWSEEFSVHSGEDRYVLRRQFTKFLILTSFGMFVGNVWIWIRSLFARPHGPFEPMAIARAADVAPGAVVLFRYPAATDTCILLRTPAGRLAAFSQKCTHLACAVYYSPGLNQLVCPCHEGYFAAETGRVLQGPPPRPLPRILLEERNGVIYATGVSPQGGGA